MISRFRTFCDARRRLYFTAAGTLAVLTLLAILPKDRSYAATSRLAMVIAFAISGIVGTFLTARAWRDYANARIALRFTAAPAPMALALRFLMDERRLARRFTFPAFFCLVAASSLNLLAQWPQLALPPLWANVLMAATITSFAALLIAPLVQRTHWINAAHLRAVLAQQARHANFKPLTPRIARAALASLEGPAVYKSGDQVFAGGFAWEWRDFNTNALILGQPGSGKTSTVLNALLEWHFIRFEGAQGFGALVQDVMGDFKGKVDRLCAKHGRTDDLFIFDLQGDPGSAGKRHCAILNPLDSADPPAEIAAALIACLKHLGLRSTDTFFLDSARVLLAHAIAVLRAGMPEAAPTIVDLHRLITQLHQAIDRGTADPAKETFEPTFYHTLLDTIGEHAPNDDDVPLAVLDAVHYVNSEFVSMPSKQRAGVIGVITQLLGELMAEPVRHFVNGRSTISMQDVVDQGKIYSVHAPLAANPRLGLIINTLIKRQYLNAVLRRREKAIPSLMLCDEFHNLFSPGVDGDSQAFSMTRQCNHASVIACQNIELLHQAAKNKSEVAALVGNCATKLFLRNSEPETNEMASRLFGEEVGIAVTQSAAADVNGLFRRTRTNYSRSTAKGRVVPAEAFTRLPVPTPDRLYAGSIVHLATRAETQRLDLTWKVHPL